MFLGDQFYEGEEGFERLTEEGQINLERFEAMLRQGQGDGQGDAPVANGEATPQNTQGREGGERFLTPKQSALLVTVYPRKQGLLAV